MKRHLAYIQHYEHIYEQSATNPVLYLSLIKKKCFPKMNDSPTLSRHSQFSLTWPINKRHLNKLLCDIKISEKAKRHSEYRRMFKPLLVPEVVKSFKVEYVKKLLHISCVTPERVWVSDQGILLLTDKSGDHLHELYDITSEISSGIFSVNIENELIYIDAYLNIKKLSNDLQKCTTILVRRDATMEPVSLCCSRLTGDLFVGMWILDLMKGKSKSYILRYNHKGELTQTIPHIIEHEPFKKPGFITENNNGDIVVTDSFMSISVLAIDRDGNNRFIYRGHPEHQDDIPDIHPYGVCTDVFSHILISDISTGSIHMLDENGQFLSFLMRNALESVGPYTLSYDVNTHLLWVGTGKNNIIYACRYIDRQDIITGKFVLIIMFKR